MRTSIASAITRNPLLRKLRGVVQHERWQNYKVGIDSFRLCDDNFVRADPIVRHRKRIAVPGRPKAPRTRKSTLRPIREAVEKSLCGNRRPPWRTSSQMWASGVDSNRRGSCSSVEKYRSTLEQPRRRTSSRLLTIRRCSPVVAGNGKSRKHGEYSRRAAHSQRADFAVGLTLFS